MITVPMPIVNTTMSDAAVFGRMCRTMMRRSEAPITRPASMNGISRSDSTVLRISRETCGTPTNASPKMRFRTFSSKVVARRMRISSGGNACIASRKRCINVSILPPK